MPAFAVREALDVYRARSGVRVLANALGFPFRVCEELAIVASELSSNIVKYGIRGTLQAEPAMRDDKVVGITLEAWDVGPPFRSFETALLDGCDDVGPIDPSTLLKRGGLGTGLGAVVRMTDSLELRYTGRAGAPGVEGSAEKCIVAVRYLKPSKHPASAG